MIFTSFYGGYPKNTKYKFKNYQTNKQIKCFSNSKKIIVSSSLIILNTPPKYKINEYINKKTNSIKTNHNIVAHKKNMKYLIII